MIRKSISLILVILMAVTALLFLTHTAAAATAKFGCKPVNLTVKTGQTFYITVAVTDTTDLYAWQMDASYYNAYLEFVTIAPGNHLRSDGSRYYLVRPSITPGTTSNEMRLATYTRLSRNTGVDGSGNIAHIYFRAIKQKLDGTTISLNDTKLIDRNALDISKGLTNSGYCKVYISDSATQLIQAPVGEMLFLPYTKR